MDNIHEIRGEYWVQGGYIDFADGDVGDRNHEGIALDAVFGSHLDDLSSLAEDLVDEEILEPGDYDLDSYGEVDHEKFQRVMMNITDALQDEKELDQESANRYVREHLGCDEETFGILQGQGDARIYMMKREGWIAVRSNNVELFGYNADRQKEVARSIRDVLHEEHGDEQELDPSQVELSIGDFQSMKSWNTTLQELEQPQVAAQQASPITTTYNKPMPVPTKDTEENKYSQPVPSKPNPWNSAWKQSGLGTDMWRGTSESITL